jgi:hypothetical protein
MLRVVATGRRINIVEFVSIKIPVAEETFRKPLVVVPHFGQGRTKSGEIPRHTGRFPFFIEYEPVGMFLDHVRDNVLVLAISELPIFDGQR